MCNIIVWRNDNAGTMKMKHFVKSKNLKKSSKIIFQLVMCLVAVLKEPDFCIELS